MVGPEYLPWGYELYEEKTTKVGKIFDTHLAKKGGKSNSMSKRLTDQQVPVGEKHQRGEVLGKIQLGECP